MHRLDINRENPEYIERGKETVSGKIEVLNRTHNIVSVNQEAVQGELKGHILIHYLPDWDAIVIAGWKENTAFIEELIINYLELTPLEHKKVLKERLEIGLSGPAQEIWKALEAIYQIRNGNKK